MKIVCYGDSNTYGYDAADVFGGRLPPEERWTELLAQRMDAEVVNCGMNGRTVPRWKRAFDADLRLIWRAAPFDLLTVMLGSNDLLTDHEPEETAEQMGVLLRELQPLYPAAQIMLIAPPPVSGFELLFEELRDRFQSLAQILQISFADAGAWGIAISADDVHFSPEGHQMFALQLAEHIKKTLEA